MGLFEIVLACVSNIHDMSDAQLVNDDWVLGMVPVAEPHALRYDLLGIVFSQLSNTAQSH